MGLKKKNYDGHCKGKVLECGICGRKLQKISVVVGFDYLPDKDKYVPNKERMILCGECGWILSSKLVKKILKKCDKWVLTIEK